MKYLFPLFLLASCASPIVQEAEVILTNPLAEKIEKEVALEALQYVEKRIGGAK